MEIRFEDSISSSVLSFALTPTLYTASKSVAVSKAR